MSIRTFDESNASLNEYDNDNGSDGTEEGNNSTASFPAYRPNPVMIAGFF